MLKQGSSWRPIDSRADFGQTQSYSIENLQRPLTIILDGMADTALDKNGDGKFDTASGDVLYIFQFPAISGVRLSILRPLFFIR